MLEGEALVEDAHRARLLESVLFLFHRRILLSQLELKLKLIAEHWLHLKRAHLNQSLGLHWAGCEKSPLTAGLLRLVKARLS